MAVWTGYKSITHKQCNVIYKAIKRGELVPPCDGRGRPKREGWVYEFEGCAHRHGSLREEDMLYNAQLAAIEETVRAIIAGELERAQAVLDGRDDAFVRNWLPDGVNPSRYWRRV